MAHNLWSPIKVQGEGENPLNLSQTVEVLTTKLDLLSKKIDNTNRTVMNLETHLDHLTRQDEYLNRRLSQCVYNNVLNQLPTFAFITLCVGTEGAMLLLSESWFPDIGKSGCIVDGSHFIIVHPGQYISCLCS
jgi:hypothetical protein